MHILKSGPLTTIQDHGRFGVAYLGVAPSGAIDGIALMIANRCVGNGPDAAGLEFTLAGPTISFDQDTIIAITGANFAAFMEPHHREIPRNQAFLAEGGSVLHIGAAMDGARGYLAVQGGLDVPLTLGSRSTHVRAKMGGFAGRPLRTGDRIETLSGQDTMTLHRWHEELCDKRENPLILRVFPASQSHLFSGDAITLFFDQDYVLRPDSDRMGFRLAGNPLPLLKSTDIASEPSFPGNIQIASGGLPIILGRDLPVTGGYTKIATIFAADFGKLAYLLPGQSLKFQTGTLDDAKAAWEQYLRLTEARFEPL